MELNMKKIATIMFILFAVSACTGTRGVIGGQKVCTNEYLFGVLSFSELFDPCGR